MPNERENVKKMAEFASLAEPQRDLKITLQIEMYDSAKLIFQCFGYETAQWMLFGFCFRFFRIFAQIATVKKFVFKSREKKIQIFLSKNACKTAKKNADKNEICLIELEINTFWFLFHTKIGKLGKFLFFFFFGNWIAVQLGTNWIKINPKHF